MRNLLTAFLVLGFAMVYCQVDCDSLEREYQEYRNKVNKDFKEEGAWYRMWNQFERNPGFSKYAIGPAYTTPLGSWDNYDQTFALRYRSSHLEFSGAWWDGTKKGEAVERNANRFSLGYFTPIAKPLIDTRQLDVKGILLQPVAGIGLSRNDGSYGAYVSPGFHVQLPYSVIGARLNAEYTLDGNLNIIPELSIQLDALRNLLDPNKVKTGEHTHVSTTASPIGGGWYRVEKKSTTTGVHVNDIGPFWGITPRYGFFPLHWTDRGTGQLNTFGLGVSGRINFLGADITVNKSQVVSGVVTNTQALDGTVKQQFDNKQVQGVVNTTELAFEGSVNIVGLVAGIIKPKMYTSMGMKTTPLNRLNFHLGMTYFIPGKVVYDDVDNAQTYTDNFFASHPQVERNAINDPLQHEAIWGVTYGMSYEMGCIGVGAYNRLTKTMGSSNMVEIYYIIPISKVLKAYRN